MTIFLFFISFILPLNLSYDFTLTGPQNKLLTWVNSNGIEQNLLLSQVSVEEKTILIQQAILPYEHEIDQNCTLTQSSDIAYIYEPSNQKRIHLQYIHMQGNQIISKNTIQLLDNTMIKISDQYTINLSASLNQSTETSPTYSLYLFNNESLLKIDSRLYSSEPTCYLLSKMTEQLCNEKGCSTLLPSHIYEKYANQTIKDFSIVNGIIVLKQNPTQLLTKSVVFGQLISTKPQNDINLSTQIKQQKVTLSNNTKVIVNFDLSRAEQSAENDLSRVSSIDESTSYDVTISITNPQQIYTLKTVNLYKGSQQVLSDRVILNPLQSLRYETKWKDGLQSQIPSVQILNENLQLEGHYSINLDLNKQTTQQQIHLQKNEEVNVNQTVQKLTVEESHSNQLAVLIGASCGGGVFVLFVVFVWLFRGKIIRKCFGKKKDNQEKNKITQSQPECDKKQSGRELNMQYEITFDQKPSGIGQLPTCSTLHSNQTEIQNPQKESNKLQCSIEKGLPIFSQKASTIQTEHFDERQSSEISEKVDRIDKPSKSQVSLSLNSNCEEKSYTRKRITRKRIISNQKKDQEKTQTI